MNDQEIDRALSAEETIAPSTGFTVSVMTAVLRESSAPPPIPFPWKRAVPLLLAAGVAVVFTLASIAALLTAGSSSAPADPWSAAVAGHVLPLFNPTTAWLLAVVVLTLAAATLPSRIRYAFPTKVQS